MNYLFKLRWHVPVRIVFAVLFLCVLIFPASVQASLPLVGQIRSFQASAVVESDRLLLITENIVYDFGGESRHGIYRTIPGKYSRNGGSYRLRLSVKGVLMDGKPAPYSITSRTPDLRIRIGDADQFVTGVHEYQIVYQTDQAINFFSDHDELYWNVTGNDWTVPIDGVSMVVRGPEGFETSNVKEECFVGDYGASDQACEVKTQNTTVWFSPFAHWKEEKE